MKDKIYHVGLIITPKGTAKFQLSSSVDGLSCEIYKYYGERVITRKALEEDLKGWKQRAESELKREFPNIKRLSIKTV